MINDDSERNRSAPPITDSEQAILAFSDMVYKLACVRCGSSLDADDVYQNVFYRYLKYHPDFKDMEHQRAWFVRTTVNCSISLLTGSWRRRTMGLNEQIPAAPNEKIGVYEAVLKLPIKLRTVIHLHYYEGYSINEIAKMLRLKEGTIKSRLHRARIELRKELDMDDLM